MVWPIGRQLAYRIIDRSQERCNNNMAIWLFLKYSQIFMSVTIFLLYLVCKRCLRLFSSCSCVYDFFLSSSAIVAQQPRSHNIAIDSLALSILNVCCVCVCVYMWKINSYLHTLTILHCTSIFTAFLPFLWLELLRFIPPSLFLRLLLLYVAIFAQASTWSHERMRLHW